MIELDPGTTLIYGLINRLIDWLIFLRSRLHFKPCSTGTHNETEKADLIF